MVGFISSVDKVGLVIPTLNNAWISDRNLYKTINRPEPCESIFTIIIYDSHYHQMCVCSKILNMATDLKRALFSNVYRSDYVGNNPDKIEYCVRLK